MARRNFPPFIGKKYLGNKNKMEVHDLDKETKNCQIDEIIKAKHAVIFKPDNLQEAHRCGYDNCHYCIGGSKR
ncbi:MAG: hypothetical protein KAJ44_02325 [Thermoplasmatales archaeon]|nr:hypothetical protein [Thermoplasmatales archaeon]